MSLALGNVAQSVRGRGARLIATRAKDTPGYGGRSADRFVQNHQILSSFAVRLPARHGGQRRGCVVWSN